MSQSGPPADAKQAQAAALQELDAAQKRKRAIDTSLASPRFVEWSSLSEPIRPTLKRPSSLLKGAISRRLPRLVVTSSRSGL